MEASTGSNTHSQTYLTRQQRFPAQLAPRALWHLAMEPGDGVRMGSDGGREASQHLLLEVAITVPSASTQLYQKPGEGRKRKATIQPEHRKWEFSIKSIYINSPISISCEIANPRSNNATFSYRSKMTGINP